MLTKTAPHVSRSLLALLIVTPAAWAERDASSVINIKAQIPTQSFHVLPANPEFGRDETLNYNPLSGSLSSLRQMYSVKNTDGSVHAYIEGGPIPLFNGNMDQNIALTTSFNGVVLTGTPKEVVTDDASTVGIHANMDIVPATPGADVSGLYTASYTVIFDNVPRVP
ncbi:MULTISPECIES: CS1 type fimbrial major subunit [unclassified Pseudomonas]|uniref:CS1 type fimbrial major subunit n=1 Tax=unclassified Pseudomonas TaxID=196821 RepID=UPI0028D3AAC4|nr:CS1 type fimbrial major subunit [uncultured Pseudomonas sp.]